MTKVYALRITGLTILAAVLTGFVWNRVAGQQLNVTTGLLLLAAVQVGLLALIEFAMMVLKSPARIRGNMRMLVVTSGILLVGLELFLRFGLGGYATYLEKNEGGGYRPLYHHSSPSWFHVYGKNLTYTHRRSEFAYPRTTNSLGLPEREMPLEKPAGEYRIIALGDSYTEGVGTSYEETWIKVVEKRLAAHIQRRPVLAFNAGVSGSDVWHEYMLLREKLVAFHPDLVIVAINASDIADVMIRGGVERFRSDGSTVVSRRPPPWEWLYGISYLFRHVIHGVFGYNHLFIKQREMNVEEEKAVDHIYEAVTAFAKLGKDRGFRIVFVMHPDRWEADRQQHGNAFGKLVSKVKRLSEIEIIDVLDDWKTTGLFARESAATLYWGLDLHNNPKGYGAFGDTVARKIIQWGLVDGD